jgi:hypothetical protein
VSKPRAVFTGWTCVSGPARFVDWLVEHGEEVSWHTFVRNVDLKTAPLEPWQRRMLKTDWSVTFLNTRLPTGEPAWVLQHSGIEILFTAGGWFDMDAQKDALDVSGYDG